jgi:hypothetical protein
VQPDEKARGHMLIGQGMNGLKKYELSSKKFFDIFKTVWSTLIELGHRVNRVIRGIVVH